MKISLTLVGLVALSSGALVACGGGGTDGPIPVTGGTTGSGGATVGTGGVTGSGGETVGSGGAASNLLFDGVKTWVDGGMNTVGIQGAFYILEDSVKNDMAVDDAFTHTQFTADTGGIEDMPVGVSKFGPDTVMPCLSGTVPQVVDELMMTGCNDALAEDQPGACQWTAQWGGGIGLNLNETGGDASVKSTWNALTANAGGPVTGFKFRASGTTDGATLRVKAKNPGDDTDYCKAFTIVPGVDFDVKIADFKPECWGSTSSKPPLKLDTIESLQWQIVSSKAKGYTIANFCIESLSWY